MTWIELQGNLVNARHWVCEGLTLVVVVAGDKVEKVLSGTDELLRVAGT